MLHDFAIGVGALGDVLGVEVAETRDAVDARVHAHRVREVCVAHPHIVLGVADGGRQILAVDAEVVEDRVAVQEVVAARVADGALSPDRAREGLQRQVARGGLRIVDAARGIPAAKRRVRPLREVRDDPRHILEQPPPEFGGALLVREHTGVLLKLHLRHCG